MFDKQTIDNFEIEDLGIDYLKSSCGFVTHIKGDNYSSMGKGLTLEEAYDDARDHILLNYNPGNLPKFKDSELADQNYEWHNEEDDAEHEYEPAYIHVIIKFSVA